MMEPNVLNSPNQQPIVWKLKKLVMPISIQDWQLQRIKQDLIKLLESWKVGIVRDVLSWTKSRPPSPSLNKFLEIAGEDEFYWIGLSYNKTSNNGDADWRWSDGNKASGNLTIHSLRVWYILNILYIVYFYICTNIVMFVELGFSIES